MNTRPRVPVPADFEANSQLGNEALRIMYGVGNKVLARWRKEANLPSIHGGGAAARARWGTRREAPSDFKDFAGRHVNRVLAEKYGVSQNTITRWRKETGTSQSIVGFRTAQLPKSSVPAPPAGEASEACQFLRPNFRPVYHRIIEGAEFKGQYVVGINVFSEAEVVAYARQRGFKTGSELLRAFDKYDV